VRRLNARPLGLALGLALGLCAANARAQSCPVPAGADPALGALDARERAQFIARELGAQARYAALWQTTWFVARTAILASEVGLAMVSPDPDDRLDARVTSVFAALPPVGMLLFGLRVVRDGPLFLRLDHLDTDASRCAWIARGEQLLARDAKNEDEQRGWLQHALQIGGSTALFLVLGLGWGHWRNAILNGLAGIALGEAQILTQPTGLVGAWERYRRGDVSDGTRRSISLRIAPLLTTNAAGVAFGGTF
jgi:hypothetical protein